MGLFVRHTELSVEHKLLFTEEKKSLLFFSP